MIFSDFNDRLNADKEMLGNVDVLQYYYGHHIDMCQMATQLNDIMTYLLAFLLSTSIPLSIITLYWYVFIYLQNILYTNRTN
jgi:hypothetical protein